MENDRIGGAHPQEYLEAEYDDTEVVQLTDYRKEVGKEVQRGQDVGQGGKRHGLEVRRDRRLAQEPQRQMSLGQQCSKCL